MSSSPPYNLAAAADLRLAASCLSTIPTALYHLVRIASASASRHAPCNNARPLGNARSTGAVLRNPLRPFERKKTCRRPLDESHRPGSSPPTAQAPPHMRFYCIRIALSYENALSEGIAPPSEHVRLHKISVPSFVTPPNPKRMLPTELLNPIGCKTVNQLNKWQEFRSDPPAVREGQQTEILGTMICTNSTKFHSKISPF